MHDIEFTISDYTVHIPEENMSEKNTLEINGCDIENFDFLSKETMDRVRLEHAIFRQNISLLNGRFDLQLRYNDFFEEEEQE